jgi:hypothetical protein
MGQNVAIRESFKKPLYSMAKCFEMAEVPLLFMSRADQSAFIEEISPALGSVTLLYSSQSDFEAQVRASLPTFDYLMVVIDEPLKARPLEVVRGYLEARDVLEADTSRLAQMRLPAPAKEHRIALFVDRATFGEHDAASQRVLAELSTRIAFS